MNMCLSTNKHTHTGHCWKSRDELTSDVLQWTPTHTHTWPNKSSNVHTAAL